MLPVDGADGEKYIDVAEFSAKVHRVLNDPLFQLRSPGRRINAQSLAGAHRPLSLSSGSQVVRPEPQPLSCISNFRKGTQLFHTPCPVLPDWSRTVRNSCPAQVAWVRCIAPPTRNSVLT